MSLRVLTSLLAALSGCGPGDPPPGSGNMEGSGEGTTATVTGSVDTTGPPVETACGPDGVALGPIQIRTNEDAAALAGCVLIEGDLMIDPCRPCVLGCEIECGDAEALTALAGLQGLERVTGSVVVGWDSDPMGNDTRTGHTEIASIAELEGLREVGGNLHLGHAPAITSAAFPVLERVGGDLLVSDSFPVDVGFAKLREVVGSLHVVGPARQRFEFPMLERANYLVVYETSIEQLVVPKLREVTVQFVAERNDRLADLTPILDTPILGGVSLSLMPRVTSLDLQSAGTNTGIFASACPALERVSIPPNVEAIAGLTLQSNASIAELRFEGLVEIAGVLDIRANDSLSSLQGLSSLQHVGLYIAISSNPQLCASEVEAFVAEVDAEGGIWSIEGNGDC